MRAAMGWVVVLMVLLAASPAPAGYEAAVQALERNDLKTALAEAREGAEQGDPRAQRLYGHMLLKGGGTKPNPKEGVRWLQAAAEKGDTIAERELGLAYLLGTGVAKDPREAARWYRSAAEKGDAPAQFVLAALYVEGRGVEKDDQESARWMRRAADQGYPTAQMALAGYFQKGIGLTRNLLQAYVWISLAAKAKEPKAAAMKKEIARELPAEQRKEGDRLAKAWRPAVESNEAASGVPPLHLKGSGTGFAVSAEGHVMTNNHVVRGCKELRVRGRDEIPSAAKLVATSRADDLALLKIDKADAVAPFRSGKEIRPGEPVVAFGFPLSGVLASSGNLTLGHVTALAGMGNDERFLQISTPIQPGNSGGPLLDMSGRIVGVTTASISTLGAGRASGGAIPQNVNFAIKGEVAAAFLKKHGVPVVTTGGSSRAIKPADVGDRARRFTLRIECLA
jgi:S1-C subfamily serine protease